MNIFETVGSCIGDAVQSIIEKNKINAQVNRLRLVMRGETKAINRSYIALGKEYYKRIRENEVSPSDDAEEYCSVIIRSGERLKRAIRRYHELIDTRVIAGCSTVDEDDNRDITLCCSYEEECAAVDKLEEGTQDEAVAYKTAEDTEKSGEAEDKE